MTGYIISSMLWALAGLVVGYFLGRAGRISTNEQVDDKVVDIRRETVTDRGRVLTSRVAHVFDRATGVIVMLLAIGSVIAMAVTLSGQQQLIENQRAAVECQTMFNKAFIKALQERNDAAATERQAQRDLLTTPNPNRDPEIGRAAIQKYLNALAEADRVRAENPLPDQVIC